MRYCYDISAVFCKLPEITGLDLTMRRDRWEGRYRINGEPYPRKRDKLTWRKWNGNIMAYEQGGESMNLPKWLVTYGGCSDYSEAYRILREQQPMRFNPFLAHERAVEVKYISQDALVAYTRENAAKNGLYRYMCRMFGDEVVENVWKRYSTGTDERGNTVYWYIDRERRVCHDKVMAYKSDGHRDKRFGAWRHYKSADGYTGHCMFGESLLRGWDGCVAVVESEKTALMCACLWEGVLFLATGGMGNVGLSRKGWTLLPDIDGAEEWKKRGDVSEWWEGWRNAPANADIGDLIEAYSRAGRLEVLRGARDRVLFNFKTNKDENVQEIQERESSVCD